MKRNIIISMLLSLINGMEYVSRCCHVGNRRRAYLEDDSDPWVLDPPAVVVEPYYTVTLNAVGGRVNSGKVTGYVYGVGATLPIRAVLTSVVP